MAGKAVTAETKNLPDSELAKKRSWILSEPAKLKKMKPAKFTTEARVVHRLGTESVSDQILSIMELIKNSYDARAKEVYITLKNMKTGQSEIIIEDNGTGMDLERLEKGWLRVATSIKHKEREKIKNRPILGEKGIGRFAVENLSKTTMITSYPEKSNTGYRILFEWDKFLVNEDLDKILSNRESFHKKREEQGLKIQLKNLRYNWNEQDVHRLWRAIRSMVPPEVHQDKFKIIVVTDEFEELAGRIESNFLNKAAFKFEATLQKTGNVKYTIWKHGILKPVKWLPYKYDEDLKCGPVNFVIYFYYLAKNKMQAMGIIINDMDEMKGILKNYGNVKIYKDGLRLSSFGNPEDDWLGLNNRSRNQPSIVPSTFQIISRVDITSKYNPEINDTSARENIIKNPSFRDLVRFIDDAIAVFAQMRGEIEKKRKSAPKKPNKYIEHARKKMRQNELRGPLLDFGKEYPYKVFMTKLEEEINECYAIGQPNAVLVLSRKLVENLLYNILEEKFPRKAEIWYNIKRNSHHDFSILIDNLEKNISDFKQDQRDLIHSLLTMIKPFRREANSKTHKVMEYLENIDEVDDMKIKEIVQIELELLKKVKANP